VRRHPVAGLRSNYRMRMTPTSNNPVHSGHTSSSLDPATRAPGTNTLGSRFQCRMRSTPNRFAGVLAPRTTPSSRPGTGTTPTRRCGNTL
jgi:hypothetical protein